MKKVEEARESWETALLATLLQLCKLLAMHTGGATGTWRQLGRSRGTVRQARGGGKGGRAVQQWWRLPRSYIHQQRCRRQQKWVEPEVEDAHGGNAVGTVEEAVATPVKPRGGTNVWGQQDLLLEMLAESVAGAGGIAGGTSRSSWCCLSSWRGGNSCNGCCSAS